MKCTGNAAAGRGSYGYPPLGMRVLMRLLISRKQQWGEWLHKWVDVVVDTLMMDISKRYPNLQSTCVNIPPMKNHVHHLDILVQA